jgi:hypothetical protein
MQNLIIYRLKSISNTSNILITIKVHTLVKTNRYMKMHGETIKIIEPHFTKFSSTVLWKLL